MFYFKKRLILLLIIFLEVYTLKTLKESPKDEKDQKGFKLEKTFNSSLNIKDEKKKIPFKDTITSYQIIDEMGFGWGLGNTLEAFKDNVQDMGLSSETLWSNPETTEKIIQAVAKKGFRTIRIPVTWRNHLIDENYTIDPEWMERIKTVVDWAIKTGVYVILNMHHDEAAFSDEAIIYGAGFYPLKRDLEESEKFLYNVWSQIAEAFNNGYDHHLIFEVMNEPRLRGNKDGYEWNFKRGVKIQEEAVECINQYSEVILKAIRKSGGNNEKRFVLFPSYSAHYFAAIDSDYRIPDDSKYNPTNIKTLVSVHMYLPYKFTMEPTDDNVEFLDSYQDLLYGYFKFLYERFILRGHHVVVGEMGVIDKNNTLERTKWGKYFIGTARKFQIAAVIWDNGKKYTDTYKEVHGQLDRRTLKWTFSDLVDAFIEASNTPLEDNPEDTFVKKNYLYTPFYFETWSVNIEFSKEMFEGLNSLSKLCLSTVDPLEPADYRRIKINKGDWSGAINFTQSDVKGAEIVDIIFLKFPEGNNDIEISLNDTTIQLISQYGMVLNGFGCGLKKLYIKGPRVTKIDPIKLDYNPDKEQSIKIKFNEDSSDIVHEIIFYNEENEEDIEVTCDMDAKDSKTVKCSGKFQYPGIYLARDKDGHNLSDRPINFIAPEEDEE